MTLAPKKNIFHQIYYAPDRATRIRKEINKNKVRLGRLVGLRLKESPIQKQSEQYFAVEWKGLNLLLDTSSLVDQTILRSNKWEQKQLNELAAAISSQADLHDSVFLDIGAYWGLYGMTAKQLGIPEVHLFEPDPRNRSQLNAQLFLNGFHSEITVHDFAASDQAGTAVFRKSDSIVNGNRGGAGLTRQDDGSGFVVQCQALDNCFDFSDQTLFCKIDVEGAELSVLKGMQKLIANNRVFMQVEAFEENEQKVKDYAAELGLTFVKKIDIDHYFTNFSSEGSRTRS